VPPAVAAAPLVSLLMLELPVELVPLSDELLEIVEGELELVLCVALVEDVVVSVLFLFLCRSPMASA